MLICWEFHWHVIYLCWKYWNVHISLTSSHSSGTNWENCISNKNFQQSGCIGNFYVSRSSYNSAASPLYSSVYRTWKKNINVTISVITDHGWPRQCSIFFCYDTVTILWLYIGCCRQDIYYVINCALTHAQKLAPEI